MPRLLPGFAALLLGTAGTAGAATVDVNFSMPVIDVTGSPTQIVTAGDAIDDFALGTFWNFTTTIDKTLPGSVSFKPYANRDEYELGASTPVVSNPQGSVAGLESYTYLSFTDNANPESIHDALPDETIGLFDLIGLGADLILDEDRWFFITFYAAFDSDLFDGLPAPGSTIDFASLTPRFVYFYFEEQTWDGEVWTLENDVLGYARVAPPAPVPLPAAGVLMLTALGGLGLARAARRSRS